MIVCWCFYHFWKLWLNESTILSDFLIGILCAVLSAGLAVWIAFYTYRRQRKIEHKDNLRYMLLLLQNAQQEYENDLKSWADFTREIDINPSELPLLKQRANYDIKRLVSELNLEQCFIACLENGIQPENFKELFSLLDFYYEVTIQIKDQLAKAKIYDYERKLEFKQITDDIQDKIRPIFGLPEWRAYQPFLDDVKIAFENVQPERDVYKDVKYWYENFIKPLKNILIKYSSLLPILNEWIRSLSKAEILYLEIEEKNKGVALDVLFYKTKLEEQKQNLQWHVNRIKMIFLNN